jgi:hypothetical protein
MPRKARLPVMNAVNTLPKARKLIASTAPDDTVSVKRSQSRTLRSLWTRSVVASVVAKECVVMTDLLESCD